MQYPADARQAAVEDRQSPPYSPDWWMQNLPSHLQYLLAPYRPTMLDTGGIVAPPGDPPKLQDQLGVDPWAATVTTDMSSSELMRLMGLR